MKTPHKHAELIKAWAGGAEIEARQGSSTTWVTVDSPNWSIHGTYRIKPEPAPDVVCYTSSVNLMSTVRRVHDDIKLTMDGETGKLKYLEILK